MACDCEQTLPDFCSDDPCSAPADCLVQSDFDCVIYHKSNSQTSKLNNLNLTNGATLTLLAEAVDVFIGQIQADKYSLPYLRARYTVNTLKQLAEAIDNQLASITLPVSGFLGNVATDPLISLDGQYWFNITTGQLKIKVNGLVKQILTA